MSEASHEFKLERWGGLHRGGVAYDTEVLAARRRMRRHVLGISAVVVAKAAATYLAYKVGGWLGVLVLFTLVLVLLFIRGTHSYPNMDR